MLCECVCFSGDQSTQPFIIIWYGVSCFANWKFFGWVFGNAGHEKERAGPTCFNGESSSFVRKWWDEVWSAGYFGCLQRVTGFCNWKKSYECDDDCTVGWDEKSVCCQLSDGLWDGIATCKIWKSETGWSGTSYIRTVGMAI